MNRDATTTTGWLRAWSVAAALAGAAGGVGCSSAEEAGEQEGAATESADDYDFQLPREGDEMRRVDAMGVALVSTVLMNRDRTPSGEDNQNRYQIDSPDVQNSPRTLFGFLHFLRALHAYWHDDLERQGFAPCSKKIAGLIVATPCTLQRLRFDESLEVVGPRVIDAVLPDYISLSFDEPLRFPNGRTPWEPISDKVFALGFLEMGGKCPGVDTLPGVSAAAKARVPRDRDGVPVCTIETFADVSLQVPENDRPFEAKFPYLARPWFYPAPSGGATYYWPKAERGSVPE